MDPDENLAASGGAIDTSDPGTPPSSPGSPPPDNSGAAPVAAPQQAQGAIDTSDNSGAAPVTPPQPQPPAAPGSANSPSYGPLAGIGDAIKKLLGGEGAISPQLLDTVAQKADPSGKMTPADRQVMAIHQASQTQGDDGALAILQANRVAYGTKAAFARTALMGTPQKPGDLNAAIKAANQAQENLPDGSNVLFSPAGHGGVVAVVQFPGSKKTVQFNLSTPQFAQFLDVGKDGQFDKLMDVSAPGMLQRLAQANAGGAAPQAPGAPAGNAERQTGDQNATNLTGGGKQQPYKWGRLPDGSQAPDALDLSGETSPRKPATDEQLGLRDNELEGKSRAMFPWASQEQQRQRYMSQQEDQEAGRQNNVDVATEKGKAANEVAKTNWGGRVEAQKIKSASDVEKSQNYSKGRVELGLAKIQAAAQAEYAKNGRSKDFVAAKLLASKIAASGPNSLNDREKAAFEQYMPAVPAGAQAPQAKTPQASTQYPSAPTDPTQRQVGQSYTSPSGKVGKWTGSGWQVQ